MTCNCLTMCRVPDVETLGGRFPMPTHAPNCNEFKQIEFMVLELDGAKCVMTPEQFRLAVAVLNDEEEYKCSSVILTQDQFDNLAEFTGF